MKKDDKRFYRQLKKQIKKTGNKKRRRFYKENLENNPAETHQNTYDYGHDQSSALNGHDGPNRKRKTKPKKKD